LVGTEPTASTHGVDLPTAMPGRGRPWSALYFPECQPRLAATASSVGGPVGADRWSARSQPHPRMAWIYRLQCPVEADLGRRFISLSANQGWQLPHHRWVDRCVPTVGQHGANRIHAWRGSTDRNARWRPTLVGALFPRVPTEVGSYRIISGLTGGCRPLVGTEPTASTHGVDLPTAMPGRGRPWSALCSLSANRGWQLPHHRWVDRWVPTVGRHGANRIHAWRGSTDCNAR